MINAIIKGLFWVITKMFNIILLPFIAILYALFPNLTDYFTYIIQYFTYALTYVRCVLQLLLVEQYTMQLLFDYFIIINSIYYAILGYKFAINIYHKFRP